MTRISARYHLNCRLSTFCMNSITCSSYASPLELGEVGLDNFNLGQKLVSERVEFRLESLNVLLREIS